MCVCGIGYAVVCADRFLPTDCFEFCPVLLNEEGVVREGAGKKDTSRMLDFSSWLLAWDRYAIGVPLQFGGGVPCVHASCVCQAQRS